MSKQLSNVPDYKSLSESGSDQIHDDFQQNQPKQYEFTCSVCFRNHTESEAIIFCKICKDYLCSKCILWHAKYNSDHGDDVIGQTEMRNMGDQPTTLLPVEKCGHHDGEVLDVYCQQHSEAVCKQCKAQAHSLCQGVIPRCSLHIETAIAQMRTIKLLSSPVGQSTPNLPSPVGTLTSNIPSTACPRSPNTSRPFETLTLDYKGKGIGEDDLIKSEDIKNDRYTERRHTFHESGKAKIFVNILTFIAVAGIVVKVVLGGLHMGNCDIEKRITYYLVVPLNMVAFTAASCSLYWYTKWRQRERIVTVIAIYGGLSLIWLIIGSVWVIPHYTVVIVDRCNKYLKSSNLNSTITDELPCCDKNTFRMAFGVTVVDWIVVVLFPVFLIVMKKLLTGRMCCK